MKIEHNIGVAIYSKEAYKRLLEITDDRENMNDTWEEWRQKKDDAKRNFKKMGLKLKEVKVDIDQLIRFCQIRSLPNNGASRSEFVQAKLSGEIK